MTSKEAPGCPEERRLDRLPPPAASNKPLTPFSIEDILSKPSVRRGYSLCGAAHPAPPEGHGGSGRPRLGQTSPLCALEELASKTFKGLEVSVLQAAEGRDGLPLFGQRNAPKKRRKSRTAFTNQQIYELEKRFLYQKYLSPADRDQISQQLGLTNAQVITWFQNRRAKMKRDLEEMKTDVESAKSVGALALEKLTALADLETRAAGGADSAPRRVQPDPVLSGRTQRPLPPPPSSPSAAAEAAERRSGGLSSEDEEEEEIDVDE